MKLLCFTIEKRALRARIFALFIATSVNQGEKTEGNII